jgi:quercetin dioxygenase-like cupin family protein
MKVAKEINLKEFPLFEAVSGKIVFSSDNIMFLLVKIPPREIVPEHTHINEQMGLCLKGKVEFKSDKETVVVDEGTFYWIKSREKHSVTSLIDEPSLFLDVFYPPRIDYLKKAKKYSLKTT